DSIRERIIQSGGTIFITRTGKDDFTARLVDQDDEELNELFSKLVN
ncbi:MAG: hypothetical protein HY305_04730, partial [Sphingobacteriales bacterium]|nr:hypothetical protein [Sphingobacteriales bacterium]